LVCIQEESTVALVDLRLRVTIVDEMHRRDLRGDIWTLDTDVRLDLHGNKQMKVELIKRIEIHRKKAR